MENELFHYNIEGPTMTPARDPKQGNLFELKAKHREQSKESNPREQSQDSHPGEHSSRASHESNPGKES